MFFLGPTCPTLAMLILKIHTAKTERLLHIFPSLTSSCRNQHAGRDDHTHTHANTRHHPSRRHHHHHHRWDSWKHSTNEKFPIRKRVNSHYFSFHRPLRPLVTASPTPEVGPCDFDHDFCGWTQDSSAPLQWSLHSNGEFAAEAVGRVFEWEWKALSIL